MLHVREVKEVPSDLESHVEPHKHDVSQLYGIIGEITVEVILDGERHEVKGDHSLRIHSSRYYTRHAPTEGERLSSINIERKGKYE